MRMAEMEDVNGGGSNSIGRRGRAAVGMYNTSALGIQRSALSSPGNCYCVERAQEEGEKKK